MQAQHLPHAAAAAAAAASLVPSIPMPPYPSSLAGGASVSASGAAGLLGLAAAPSSLITPSSSHFHAIKDEKGLMSAFQWSVCHKDFQLVCHFVKLHTF